MECIFAKYNKERLPRFQTETIIQKDESQLFIRKKGLTKEADSHISQIFNNYLLLNENYKSLCVAKASLHPDKYEIYLEYVNGISLDQKLFNSFIENDNDNFLKTLEEYKAILYGLNIYEVEKFEPSIEFIKIFGECTNFKADSFFTDLANIDLTFDNVISDDDNDLCIIDYEWVFRFEVPVNFIAYRSINEFFAKYHGQIENFISIDDVFRVLNIDDEEINIYRGMESSFQKYVFGEDYKYRINSRYEQKNENISDIINSNKQYKELLISQNQRIEELSLWGKRLDEEIERRDQTIVSQNSRIEELSMWGKSLDAENDKRDQIIHSQSTRIEELSVWGKSLDEEIEKRNQIIHSQNSKIEELSVWGKSLDAESIKKDEIIADQRKEIDELNQLVESIKTASDQVLAEQEKRLQPLLEKETALNKIYGSRGWKYLLKLYRLENGIIPLHSKRREALKSGYFVIKNLKRIGKHINKENFKKLIDYSRKESPGKVLKHIKSYLNRYKPVEKIPLQIYETKDVYEELEFEHQNDPLVSIVIPVYNQWNYTYSCLKSILENTKGINYEIIIADDVSSDETININNYISNINVVRNQKNLGFLLNCNNAARHARGKYVLFLNNDTNVQKDWLRYLLDLIERDSSIGMVGSKLVYADGRLQEAGGIIWNDASGWNYGRLDDPEKPEYNYVKEVDYISGASIMIRADLWNQTGGFDERYAPAYFEDSDLAFEVRKHGYKVVYQPKSIVVHFEGISHGTDTNTGIKSYQIRNKELFIEKWKDTLKKDQFDNANKVFLARDRSRYKKTILVIDHYVPHFDKDAGSRTTYQYLKLFTEMGLNVKFIGDNFYRHEPYTSILQQLGIEVLYGVWYSENWEKWIKEIVDEIDYVYLNRPHISIKYIDFLKQNTKARILYYGHDLHYLRELREYDIIKDKDILKSSENWKKIEHELISKADVIYYPSQIEIDDIKKYFPSRNAKAIPAYIFDTKDQNKKYDSKCRKDIMFVGGFTHKPNIDAVLWFVKEIFPLVTNKIPEIKFYIIGSNPTDEIKELASESIIVTGFVTDEQLDSYYDNCRLTVVPLRYGAGVKGKIVEAMYKQLPVITTPVGAEGLNDIYKCIQVCNTDETFAKELVFLYNDDYRLKELSSKALSYVVEYFSEKKVLEVIKEDILI